MAVLAANTAGQELPLRIPGSLADVPVGDVRVWVWKPGSPGSGFVPAVNLTPSRLIQVASPPVAAGHVGDWCVYEVAPLDIPTEGVYLFRCRYVENPSLSLFPYYYAPVLVRGQDPRMFDWMRAASAIGGVGIGPTVLGGSPLARTVTFSDCNGNPAVRINYGSSSGSRLSTTYLL